MYRIIHLSFNGTFACVQYSPFDGTDHCIDWHRKVCSSLSELGDPKRVSATAHQCEYDDASRIISSIQRINRSPSFMDHPSWDPSVRICSFHPKLETSSLSCENCVTRGVIGWTPNSFKSCRFWFRSSRGTSCWISTSHFDQDAPFPLRWVLFVDCYRVDSLGETVGNVCVCFGRLCEWRVSSSFPSEHPTRWPTVL